MEITGNIYFTFLLTNLILVSIMKYICTTIKQGINQSLIPLIKSISKELMGLKSPDKIGNTLLLPKLITNAKKKYGTIKLLNIFTKASLGALIL